MGSGGGEWSLRYAEVFEELNLGSGCSLLAGGRPDGREGARQHLSWLNSPSFGGSLCSLLLPGCSAEV